MADSSGNVEWQKTATSDVARERTMRQRGCVVWLTGLSGSGKSTIGLMVEAALVESGHAAFLLDGDNLRHGLCSDLGFSELDRDENIRRVSEVANLFAESGVIALCAFISPMLQQRELAREIIGADRFVEVFVDAPIKVCEERDPKGLYGRVRKGEIEEFTGVTAPYESPVEPDLHIHSEGESAACSAERVVGLLQQSWIMKR